LAPKKSTKTVEVTLSERSEKKHVVRFDNGQEGAALSSIYLSKAADTSLGSPESVTVTIAAA
jgi:hypothetical protein